MTILTMLVGALFGFLFFGLLLAVEAGGDGTYYQIDGFFDPHFNSETGKCEGYSGSVSTTSSFKCIALLTALWWWRRRDDNDFFTVTVVRYPHGDSNLRASKTIFHRERPYDPADHIKKPDMPTIAQENAAS